jgi:hypothetical protein
LASSGGIEAEDTDKLKSFLQKSIQSFSIDINSRFETHAGVKGSAQNRIISRIADPKVTK